MIKDNLQKHGRNLDQAQAYIRADLARHGISIWERVLPYFTPVLLVFLSISAIGYYTVLTHETVSAPDPSGISQVAPVVVAPVVGGPTLEEVVATIPKPKVVVNKPQVDAGLSGVLIGLQLRDFDTSKLIPQQLAYQHLKGLKNGETISHIDWLSDQQVIDPLDSSYQLASEKISWPGILARQTQLLLELENASKISSDDVLRNANSNADKSNKIASHLQMLRQLEISSENSLRQIREYQNRFKLRFSKVANKRRAAGSDMTIVMAKKLPEKAESSYQRYADASAAASEIEAQFKVWKKMENNLRDEIVALRNKLDFFERNFWRLTQI